MQTKTMGSTPPYLTPSEAAEALDVSVAMVHVFDRNQLLEAHYPDGKRAKKFLAEDVYALCEVREQYGGDFMRKLPQIVLRAVVSSRRTEKKLDELIHFLGLNDVVLSTEKEDVVSLHLKVEHTLRCPRTEDDGEALTWARKILAINEEYLELVRLLLGDEEPWKPYLELAQVLANGRRGRTRSFLDHARANLRNAAYFYERAFRGPRSANKTFPGERFSGRLIQRLLLT